MEEISKVRREINRKFATIYENSGKNGKKSVGSSGSSGSSSSSSKN